jgi:cytochrome c peroxidase
MKPRRGKLACLKLAFVLTGAIGPLAFAGGSFAQEEETAALLKDARKSFEPLSKDITGQRASFSPGQVRLGRMLFFEPRISADGVGSCVRCHQPALYGADALPKSRGVHDKVLPRNAPTVLNAALQFKAHWDGVFENVEEQAAKALVGPAFGNPDRAAAMAKLKAISGYAEMFEKAFPGQNDPVSAENWGQAIGAYERTLITPSRFDDFLTGKVEALSVSERRGLRAFIDQGCIECHKSAGVGGRTFEKFGIVDDYWKETGGQEIDKGRFNVTRNADDLYVFKVPSLRNVAMTPPYFHDGSVKSLAEAVRVMAKVQIGSELSEAETTAIVSFLRSLTGDLPEDFANAPVLPSASFAPDAKE